VTPVVQFRSGLAAERFVSQARVEARGRPVKIDDDFSDDVDSDDDGDGSVDVDDGDSDYDSDCADFDDDVSNDERR